MFYEIIEAQFVRLEENWKCVHMLLIMRIWPLEVAAKHCVKYLKDSEKIVHQGIAVKYGMEEQEEI